MEKRKDLIAVGFTRNECILLSPLFRKLFQFRDIVSNPDIFDLKNIVNQDSIIVCNGSIDFYELDAACIFAMERKARICACIFTDIVKEASLAIARQHNVQVILAELEREDELIECAQAIKEDRNYMSKGLFNIKAKKYSSFIDYFNLLSKNERIACIGMLEGYKHEHIASLLGVSKSTVDTYCSKVLSKFEASSIAQLFQIFAFKNL